MKLDLHLHSNVSDGKLDPAALVRAAAEAGLDVIALTDHDTAAGVADALAMAEELPIQVVPGIEISTRWEGNELHILGYGIDPAEPRMAHHQEASVGRRVQRMRGMVDRLRDLGIPITYEEVEDVAGPTVKSIGRPHLARALHNAGHTRYYGEAFARFIGDQGPAFVAQDFPEVRDAIDAIHQAGGVAAWAHPPMELFEEQIRRFADWGLDGVECLRPTTAPADSQRLEHRARELDLLVTGGSDWHGPHSGELGTFSVRPEEIPGLAKRFGWL